MEDHLNILPNDNDVFDKKKSTSEQQKSHLAKARQKAHQALQRKKEAKKKDVQSKDTLLSDEEEKQESEEEEMPIPVKPKKIVKPKKNQMSEEEAEIYRFEKFMKQMQNYEKVKELHEQEVAESKKQEFYKNNHERIMALIEQDDKKKEIAESTPTTVEKVEEVEHPKLKKLTSSFCNINTNRRRL